MPGLAEQPGALAPRWSPSMASLAEGLEAPKALAPVARDAEAFRSVRTRRSLPPPAVGSQAPKRLSLAGPTISLPGKPKSLLKL